MLDSAFTHDEINTLIHILDEWETTASVEHSSQRKETATLLKAKLFLQRNDALISEMFDTKIPQSTTQRSEMELAEQYMRECGIWPHFESYLFERNARVR